MKLIPTPKPLAIPPVKDKIPPPPEPPASRVIREGYDPQIPPMRNPTPPPTRGLEPPTDWPEPGLPPKSGPAFSALYTRTPKGANLFRQLLEYLKGSAEHLGTTKNLLREMTVGVGTAVLTYLVLHFAVPEEPSVVGELRDVINQTVSAHQEADSLRFEYERFQPVRRENDSLRRANALLEQELLIIHNHH